MTNSAFAVEDHVPLVKNFANATIKQWIKDPKLIAAINRQNHKNQYLTETEILSLDKKWRAETKTHSRPLIESILLNEASKILTSYKNSSDGMVLELILMDNKGLNVAQSDVTSDYWQGDEAKWQKTYLKGPNTIFVDEVEIDESSQRFQSQMSISVTDPATGTVIGAITAGINVEDL